MGITIFDDFHNDFAVIAAAGEHLASRKQPGVSPMGASGGNREIVPMVSFTPGNQRSTCHQLLQTADIETDSLVFICDQQYQTSSCDVYQFIGKFVSLGDLMAVFPNAFVCNIAEFCKREPCPNFLSCLAPLVQC
ncbi:hypothetical protein D2E64_20570 [Mycobacteroides abscessus]|nr:hypothetical protein S7W_03557 [Mycobacteroides abscessus M94]OLT92623.1 hypothetical protein BKG58_05745 [Mycobacteroides abscessus subsp. abscessus]PVA33828.1 hypothetical protein DDJ98_13250 [Mycobacteroides abscessus]RIR02846.1 hypothetical protein D2E35_00165 [Mycobacteroides abscessus]RIR37364.1 hypothetical protein D2E36_20110 [Mycobacteroides abscessus]